MSIKIENTAPVVGADFSFDEGELSPDILSKVMRDLTFKSMDGKNFGFGEGEVVQMFRFENGRVYVPRRYAAISLPTLLKKAEVEVSEGEDISLIFNEDKQSRKPELKEKQDKMIGEFLGALQLQANRGIPFQGGLSCAPCGAGKTVVADKLISVIGKTTLVIVHKEFLMDQWRERLLEYTDIKPDEIGHVQRDLCLFRGKKVVLAMVHSLIQREYPEDLRDWAGVIVVDEVHRMAAPTFNQAIPLFSAKIRIGLTATPRRADGLQPVFEWHIGNVLAKIEGSEVCPKIYQIPFEMFLPSSVYMFRGRVLLGRLMTAITLSQQRNAFFVREMAKAVKAGRRVMLLSDRLEHLSVIKQGFDAVMAGTATSGFYVGGMKKEDRETSSKADAILGTFQMAKEGLDIPEIDTLFLSTPHGDVQQPVGRILRSHEDKKVPIVVDLVDTIPICRKFAMKRLNQYRKLGYEIVKAV